MSNIWYILETTYVLGAIPEKHTEVWEANLHDTDGLDTLAIANMARWRYIKFLWPNLSRGRPASDVHIDKTHSMNIY